MRILYLYTDYFQNYDILWALLKKNVDVDVIDQSFDTYQIDQCAIDKLHDRILSSHYDCVFSFGYVPYISDICSEHHVLYAAWTYDSILHALYTDSIENPYNVLFVFDLAEKNYLQQHFSISYLYHLPLAANTERIQTISYSAEDIRNYQCDISFVGNLYQQNTYVDLAPILSPEERAYFEQAFSYFEGNWNGEQIFDWFSTSDANYLQKRLPDYLKNTERLPHTRYFADILLSKPIASRERIHILNMIAKEHSIRLYTAETSDVSVLDGVDCYSSVNYYDAMSKVFQHSKINLNITLHSIVSGIPLRCYDIMAAGGFLLTNYQEELEDYFRLDQDIVTYRCYEELLCKIDYYLNHETQRKQIAQSGFQKVLNGHTYKHRISTILNTIQHIIS